MMKRFNKYLFCICLFIISMFIFSNYIKAYTSDNYFNINYDSISIQNNIFNKEAELTEFINFMDNYLISILESQPYDYVIYLGYNGGDYTYNVVQKLDTNIDFSIRSFFKSGYLSGYELKTNNASTRYFCYTYADFKNDKYTDLNIYNDFINKETFSLNNIYPVDFLTTGDYYYYDNSYINGNIYSDDYRGLIYYRSDCELKLVANDTYPAAFVSAKFNNSELHYVGDSFLSYYDVMINSVNSSIVMEKTFANDLEGNEIYNIRVDFENVFNSNYKYQVRNEYEEWQDVTSNVLDAYQYGYYYYDYTLRFNSKVYARVLDSNDNVIATNEIEVTELDYISFNEIISTQKYSRVEFEFELPTSNSCVSDINCILTALNYNIRNVTKEGLDNTLTFGIPYLEKRYLYSNEASSTTKTDTIPLSDVTSNQYIGNYDIIFDSNTTNLKLVVPLDYIIASYVRIAFNSSLQYSVNYIERSDEYIGSVDITGKAGVMFIPKQIDEDMLIGFNFHPTATYSLQLRDTYESNYKVIDYYSIGYCDDRDYSNVDTNVCNNGTNGYQAYINFKKGELKQSVFIINRDYYQYQDKEKQAIVYYDTRYFEYVIYDEITSTPTFNHPITDEEIILGDLTDYDSYYTDEVHTSFFTIFSNAFEEFRKDVLKIFSYVTELWNGLPGILQKFYVVIFSLILFIFLIKFIL